MRSQFYKARSRDAFDRQARGYESTRSGRHSRALREPILAKLQAPFSSLLDVGCGTGEILRALVGKNARLAGIDLAPEMIRVALEKLGERADLRLADSESLPWTDHSFEIVLCADSFHHYPHPERVLAEMKRVLVPGGRLILADVFLPAPVRPLVNLVLPLGREGDVRVYSKRGLRTHLELAGFSLVSWERVARTAMILEARA